MLSGNSRSAKKLHLLYDRENKHYNIITDINFAMAKRFIYNGCDNYTTISTNVTKFAPGVLLHQLVLRIRPSIVVHATDGFSVRNVFRII